MSDSTANYIRAALRGDHPLVMARLPVSFAVFGYVQFLPGYSLLLVDDPAIHRLTDLPQAARRDYLHSVDILAEAVELACAADDPAFIRVNIEILGNTDPQLHAHIWPRYSWEDADLVRGPVGRYPEERWSDPATAVGPEHDRLRAAITDRLTHLAG